MQPDSPPIILPRELILLAFLWLVGAWILTIGVRPPIHVTPASYEPAVRMLNQLLMIGIMIGWPLYRLSQQRASWPIRQTLLDMMVMLAMIQVVIWPMRLLTTWSRETTAAMDANFAAWLLLAGAVVAAARASQGAAGRTLGMVACIAICLLGPAIAWLGVSAGIASHDFALLSPLMSIHLLGRPGLGDISAAYWAWIALTAVAGMLAWLAPWLIVRRQGRSAAEIV